MVSNRARERLGYGCDLTENRGRVIVTERNKLVLYGSDRSTYVRTVRMILANKQLDYERVSGSTDNREQMAPMPLARNPYGREPVIAYRGLKLTETSAIARYLDDVIPGPTHTPKKPADRARMNMGMGIVDAHGYDALITLAGYHLFPDFVGGRDEKVREACIDKGRLVLQEIMKIRAASPFIAGELLSIADCYLAPLCFYVSLTDDADGVFDIEGFNAWWERITAQTCYQETMPNLSRSSASENYL